MDSGDESETPAKKKKLYRKPSFRYDKIFKTQALSCGKTLMDTICKHSKKVS